MSGTEDIKQKIKAATEGLSKACYDKLLRLGNGNGIIIADYLLAYKIENDVKDSTRDTVCDNLELFIRKVDKSVDDVTRQDVLLYLSSMKKPEDKDPHHKWKTTCNLVATQISQFFRWFYYPDVGPKRRKTPDFVVDLPRFKRGGVEEKTYKPSDMWTQEDDEVFLRRCPDHRIKCHHAIAASTGARPHEILKLKIGDLKWPSDGSGPSFEVTGKTGCRELKIVHPYYANYVKQWIELHPKGEVPSSYLIYSKKTGGKLAVDSLWSIYTRELKPFFTNLRNDAIGQVDRNRIERLLLKPWNPYVIRHSTATRYLGPNIRMPPKIANQWFGWSDTSNMAATYQHFYGNEAAEVLAEAFGLAPKVRQEPFPQLRQCTNVTCKEMNNPDAPFCVKCRVPLTVVGYIEDRNQEEEEKAKQRDELQTLKDQLLVLTKQVSVLSEKDKKHIDDYNWEKGWVQGGKPEPILLGQGSRINRLGIDALLHQPEWLEGDEKHLTEKHRKELEHMRSNPEVP
jgi:integrase/recombinase XerD